MSVRVAELEIRLQQTGSIQKDLANTGQALDRASEKGGKLAGLMKGALMGGAGLAAGAVVGLGAVLFDGVKTAGTFESKMSAVKATTGGTEKEMKALKKTALDLGKATDVGSVSASDAADAIFELGKAGLSTEKIIDGGARAALQLAAAAGPDFGVAASAELAADAMNTFGKEGLEAVTVANTLVGAANASSIGLSELKFGFSAVGSVANTVGMTFKDTATALAVFGQNGLKGSDAGTSLKAMLMNLQPQTTKQWEAFRELGLYTDDAGNAFFDAEGKIRPLNEIAGTLKMQLSSLTEAQRLSALETIFGSDAVRAASILYSEGSEGVGEMEAAMTRQGNAARVAGEMNNNLKGKWEAFTGTVDTLKIAIGEKLLPVASRIVDKLNEKVSGFLDWLGTPEGQAMLDGIATSIGTMADKAFKFVEAVTSGDSDKVISFFDSLGGVGGKLADQLESPGWGNFGGFLDSLNNGQSGLSGFEEFFGGIETALTNFKTNWDNAWQNFADSYNQIADNFGWDRMVGPLEKAAQDVYAEVTAMRTSTDAETVLMRDNVGLTFSQLKEKALAECVLLSDGARAKFEGMKNTVKEESRLMKAGYLENTAAMKTEGIANVGGLTTETITKLRNMVAESGVQTDKLKTDSVADFNALKNECLTPLQGLSDEAVGNSIIPDMVRKIGTEFETMKTKGSGEVTGLKTDVLSTLGGMATQALTNAGTIGGNIVSGIKSGISNAWEGIKTWFSGLTGGLIQAGQSGIRATSPSKDADEKIGRPIPQGIVQGINGKWPDVTAALVMNLQAMIGTAVTTLAAEKPRMHAAFYDIATGALEGAATGMTELEATLRAQSQTWWANFRADANEGFADVTGALEENLKKMQENAIVADMVQVLTPEQVAQAVQMFDAFGLAITRESRILGALTKQELSTGMGDAWQGAGIVGSTNLAAVMGGMELMMAERMNIDVETTVPGIWKKRLSDMFMLAMSFADKTRIEILEPFFNNVSGMFSSYTGGWEGEWGGAMNSMVTATRNAVNQILIEIARLPEYIVPHGSPFWQEQWRDAMHRIVSDTDWMVGSVTNLIERLPKYIIEPTLPPGAIELAGAGGGDFGLRRGIPRGRGGEQPGFGIPPMNDYSGALVIGGDLIAVVPDATHEMLVSSRRAKSRRNPGRLW